MSVPNPLAPEHASGYSAPERSIMEMGCAPLSLGRCGVHAAAGGPRCVLGTGALRD